MRPGEEIEARIAEARESRVYADSCVESASSPDSRAYWEQRVRELSQQIWELEWALS